ncbi:hypothetical protein [Mesorhizobium sp. CN2-181]|uniref:hypothetical protein n=1 Tax=Mesorhizobium yinganensis TaxID=3157707 RepID=UPI0032B7A14F
MSDRQTISVREVRKIALAVFDKLAASGIETIEVGRATYWSVFPTDIFSAEKPDLVVSDIADDLGDLRDEIGDPESPLSLGLPWHALHHLAGICSALAAATIEPSLSEGQVGGEAS